MKTMKRSLTRTEQAYFDILCGAKKPVSIEQLMKLNIRRPDSYNGSNLVAAHMMNLKRKLASEYVIESVHGFGYQIFPIEK